MVRSTHTIVVVDFAKCIERFCDGVESGIILMVACIVFYVTVMARVILYFRIIFIKLLSFMLVQRVRKYRSLGITEIRLIVE